jgi:hypothetical protein
MEDHLQVATSCLFFENVEGVMPIIKNENKENYNLGVQKLEPNTDRQGKIHTVGNTPATRTKEH